MSVAHTAFRGGKSSCVTGIFLHNPPAGMTEKPIQLGLAGLGTVGSGVYETLCRNHALLEARSKIPFRLKRIAVRNLEKPRETVVPRELLTDDWQDLVNDPEIDIIIELIGGTRQAYDLVTLALRAGKPVVTGNKALLAEYGAEIFKLSAEMGTPIYFEASAGGGIPIIQSLQNSLICNHINSIVGIINGTSNYILSAMGEHGADYADALAQAQKLGFAEEDPSLDVNGWDAAHKALILAMLADLISCARGFLARHFPSLESGKGLQTQGGPCSLRLPDWLKPDGLLMFSLKMFPACYRMTKAGRFIPSSVHFGNWGTMWNGRCLTARILVYRKTESGFI